MRKKIIITGSLIFLVAVGVFFAVPQLQKGFLKLSPQIRPYNKGRLIEMMKTNPEEADLLVRGAKKFSDGIRIDEVVQGNVEIEHSHDFLNKKSADKYFIRQYDGERVQIVNSKMPSLSPGTKLRATGLFMKDVGLSVKKDKFVVITPGTFTIAGTFKVLVIPSTNSKSRSSLDELRTTLSSIFFGDDSLSVKKFYERMSYGYLHIEGAISTAVIIDSNSIDFEDLIDAADPEIDYRDYDAYYFVRDNENCSAMYGTIGKNQFTTNEGIRNLAVAVTDAGCIGRDFNDVFRHEFGHMLNLKHAGQWMCKQSPLFGEPINPNCIDDYGDSVVMGTGQIFELTPTHRDKISNYRTIKSQTINVNGTYWLYKLINAPEATKNQYQQFRIETEKGYYSLAYNGQKVSVRFIPIGTIDGLYSGDNSAETLLIKDLRLSPDDNIFLDGARNISISLIEKDSEKAKVQVSLNRSIDINLKQYLFQID